MLSTNRIRTNITIASGLVLGATWIRAAMPDEHLVSYSQLLEAALPLKKSPAVSDRFLLGIRFTADEKPEEVIVISAHHDSTGTLQYRRLNLSLHRLVSDYPNGLTNKERTRVMARVTTQIKSANLSRAQLRSCYGSFWNALQESIRAGEFATSLPEDHSVSVTLDPGWYEVYYQDDLQHSLDLRTAFAPGSPPPVLIQWMRQRITDLEGSRHPVDE